LNPRIIGVHYLHIFVQALTITITNTRQQNTTKSTLECTQEHMFYSWNTLGEYKPNQLLITQEYIHWNTSNN